MIYILSFLQQLNIWDRPLSLNEMNSTYHCGNDPQGNYVSWDLGWDLYEIKTTDMELQDICDTRRDTFKHFWFPKLSQADAYYVCDAIGGSLPEISSEREAQYWHNLTKRHWPDRVGKEKSDCASKYWTTLTDEFEEGVWVRGNDIMRSPGPTYWALGEPDGYRFESCAIIYYLGLRDGPCQMLQCALCRLPKTMLYSFKGNCAVDKRHIYFNVFQEVMGHLEFRGFGGNLIEKQGNEWLYRDKRNGTIIARMEMSEQQNFPMGRKKWFITTDICGQSTGERIMLLSPCKDGEFTCNDGKCITLKYRCDLKYDCYDHSDEYNCKLVKLPQGYQSDVPPRTLGSLMITSNVTIDSVKVDTLSMIMKVSFKLNMAWVDNRLQYINVKEKTSLNKVKFHIVREVWSPIVSFVNTEEGHRTIIDSEAQMVIYKQSNSSYSDSSTPEEGLSPYL